MTEGPQIKNPSPDDLPENACGHYTLIDNPELKPKYEVVETVVDGRRIHQLNEVNTGPAQPMDEGFLVAIPYYFTYDNCPRHNNETGE